jgi:hypothetical protein
MDSTNRLYVFGALILLLITLAFGVWIHVSGKPYNNTLFTVHKLSGIATAVFCALFIIRALKIISPTGMIVIVIAVAALSILALAVSGALMSAKSAPPFPLNTIHTIATFVFAISCGGTIFQIASKLQ